MKGGFLSRKFFFMAKHEIDFNGASHSKKIMLASGISLLKVFPNILGKNT